MAFVLDDDPDDDVAWEFCPACFRMVEACRRYGCDPHPLAVIIQETREQYTTWKQQGEVDDGPGCLV